MSKYTAEEYGKLAESAEAAANSGRLMMIESSRSMEMVASALRVASRATEEGIARTLCDSHGYMGSDDAIAQFMPAARAILKHLHGE